MVRREEGAERTGRRRVARINNLLENMVRGREVVRSERRKWRRELVVRCRTESVRYLIGFFSRIKHNCWRGRGRNIRDGKPNGRPRLRAYSDEISAMDDIFGQLRVEKVRIAGSGMARVGDGDGVNTKHLEDLWTSVMVNWLLHNPW